MEEVGTEMVTQEEVKTTVEEVKVVKGKEEEGQGVVVLVEGTILRAGFRQHRKHIPRLVKKMCQSLFL